MQVFHQQPVPFIFAVCQGVQELANRTFNLLGIFDRLIVFELPDGTKPSAVGLQVVTVWTGGEGEFPHVLRVLDEDANLILEAPGTFRLNDVSQRHYQVNLISFPLREGPLTLTVGRGDEELLRQQFTIEVAPFPGTPT